MGKYCIQLESDNFNLYNIIDSKLRWLHLQVFCHFHVEKADQNYEHCQVTSLEKVYKHCKKMPFKRKNYCLKFLQELKM